MKTNTKAWADMSAKERAAELDRLEAIETLELNHYRHVVIPAKAYDTRAWCMS